MVQDRHSLDIQTTATKIAALQKAFRKTSRAKENFLRLIREAEQRHVAVLEDVLFSFETVFPCLAGGSGRTGGNQVVKGNHLGFDEAFFKIGVNHTGALRGGHAVLESPSAHFLFSCGEIRGQSQQVVTGTDQQAHTTVAHAKSL